MLSGSTSLKATCKKLVKSTPGSPARECLVKSVSCDAPKQKDTVLSSITSSCVNPKYIKINSVWFLVTKCFKNITNELNWFCVNSEYFMKTYN